MSREPAAKSIAANLKRAGRHSETNALLTFVTTGREHASALTATSDKLIDSWREGGMDFLWKTKDQLGLPESITGSWTPVPRFKSPETHHMVYPAYIPARDQTVVYAVQISSSHQVHFKAHPRTELGADADGILAGSSRVARLIWQDMRSWRPAGATSIRSSPSVRSSARALARRQHSATSYTLLDPKTPPPRSP
jgi:hypothetical protein